jgi:hypothetical protein
LHILHIGEGHAIQLLRSNGNMESDGSQQQCVCSLAPTTMPGMCMRLVFCSWEYASVLMHSVTRRGHSDFTPEPKTPLVPRIVLIAFPPYDPEKSFPKWKSIYVQMCARRRWGSTGVHHRQAVHTCQRHAKSSANSYLMCF